MMSQSFFKTEKKNTNNKNSKLLNYPQHQYFADSLMTEKKDPRNISRKAGENDHSQKHDLKGIKYIKVSQIPNIQEIDQTQGHPFRIQHNREDVKKMPFQSQLQFGSNLVRFQLQNQKHIEKARLQQRNIFQQKDIESALDFQRSLKQKQQVLNTNKRTNSTNLLFEQTSNSLFQSVGKQKYHYQEKVSYQQITNNQEDQLNCANKATETKRNQKITKRKVPQLKFTHKIYHQTHNRSQQQLVSDKRNSQTKETSENQSRNFSMSNPVLNMSYQDYKSRHTSKSQLQLYEISKRNQFVKFYNEQHYLKDKIKLQKEIEEQILRTIEIKRGKYTANILLTEVLQQYVNQIKIQEQLFYLIQQLQEEPQLVNIKHQRQIYIQMEKLEPRSKTETIVQPKDLKYLSQKSLTAENNKSFSKQIDSFLSLQSKIDAGKGGQQAEKQQSDQTAQKILNIPLNTFKKEDQTITLHAQIERQKQDFIICQQTQKHLRIQIQNQTTNVDQLQKEFLLCKSEISQLSISHSQITQVQKTNQLNFKNKMIQARLQEKSIERQKQKLLVLQQTRQKQKQIKAKEMIGHCFDVLYIQLQKLTQGQRKRMTKKQKKTENTKQDSNLPIKSNQSLQNSHSHHNFAENNADKSHLIWLYQYFFKQNSIQAYQSANILNSTRINPSWSTNFYDMLIKMLKIYFCVKIEQKLLEKGNQFQFTANLFDLLDMNSYHSQNMKQGYFNFTGQFINYASRVINYLRQRYVTIFDDEKHSNNFFEQKQQCNQQINLSSQNKKLQEKQSILLLSVQTMLQRSRRKKYMEQHKNKIIQIFKQILILKKQPTSKSVNPSISAKEDPTSHSFQKRYLLIVDKLFEEI